MKRFLQFLFISFLVLASEAIVAQTASDFYLPLAPGNNLHLYTQWPPVNQGWTQRTTTYNIDGTDSIGGKLYFKEVAREFMIDFPADSDVFRVLWLRKDDAGNIVVGAANTTGTLGLDSAVIIDPAYPIFPNEFLTPGYSKNYSALGMPDDYDSVISVTETAVVPFGTFTNCIYICSTHFDKKGQLNFREYVYYAKGIGEVMTTRDIPDSDAHGDGLISYNIATSVQDKNPVLAVKEFSLGQNYPNPFNPGTTINYSIAKAGNVRLTIYNSIGSKVATLIDEYKPAGNYSFQFNKSNLASGIYLYRLESGNYIAAKKFILMK